MDQEQHRPRVTGKSTSQPAPTIVPLTPDRWDDLVDLFGPKKGAASGCWCMWHRLPGRPAWNEMGAEGRRDGFHERVGEGPPPGLMAYRDGLAVGWVALAPREELPRFQKQKVSALPPEASEAPGAVLALHCFFIRPGHRKTGLMRALTLAAIGAARASGARAVDACPIEPDRPMMWGEGFVGLVPLFQSLGFAEIARRSPRRPLMRLSLT